MSLDLQSQQNDDASNPAFLNVLAGETQFKDNCVSCHSDMSGVSVRFPKTHIALNKTVNLATQINYCANTRVKKPVNNLNLESYIALQSRGMVITSPSSIKGEAFFKLRQGQLNLSCAQCHDDNAGQKLGDAIIPYGASNGYPQYRLEWQATGTLTRRIRNCLTGMRASMPLDDDDIYVELEIYLKHRSSGLKSEAPAIRP